MTIAFKKFGPSFEYYVSMSGGGGSETIIILLDGGQKLGQYAYVIIECPLWLFKY